MLRLAWPVVLAQVGIMLMGVVDTAMVGRVGTSAVAAVALGHIYWVNVTIGGLGILMVLDPVVSQATGANDDSAVARGVQRGIIMALALSVPSALLLIPGEFFFSVLRQPVDVTPVAATFSRISIAGMVPFYLFYALRQSLQAMAETRPVVIAIVVSNVVNFVLDYALIYGHFGFPALGVQGSAISTVISRWLMFALVAWFGWRQLRGAIVPWRAESGRIGPLLRMARIGLPVGLQSWLEIAVFSGGAIALGWFGAVPLAAHEVAINLAALTFMFPMGVSAAAAAMVGRAIGRNDLSGARRDAVAALAIGTSFMAVAAVLFLTIPVALAMLFVHDPETIATAASLIFIAGIFQLFDGIQAVATGVLRGTGDTRVPMLLHLLAFWGVGIPLCLWLAFRAGLGPQGVWWGYVGALMVAATIQLLRVRWRLRQDIRRLQIDESAEWAVVQGV
ncbi:MAG: MATE family efflux transporter [Gemmatimonadaceae bacterium]